MWISKQILQYVYINKVTLNWMNWSKQILAAYIVQKKNFLFYFPSCIFSLSSSLFSCIFLLYSKIFFLLPLLYFFFLLLLNFLQHLSISFYLIFLFLSYSFGRRQTDIVSVKLLWSGLHVNNFQHCVNTISTFRPLLLLCQINFISNSNLF